MVKKSSKKSKKSKAIILIADTNQFWQKEKNEVISQEFEKFWSAHSSKYKLKLIIPDIVKGELLYQHTESALETLKKINSKIDTLERTAGTTYSKPTCEEELKNNVEQKINSWLKTKKALVVKTPIEKINWEEIIHKAIWREAPFERNSKEKGFRDAMIFETVLKVVLKSYKQQTVLFVTGDVVLREVLERRLKKINRFSCHETLHALSSHFKMNAKKLKPLTRSAIIKAAALKFNDLKTEKGLLNDMNIEAQIKVSFSDKFIEPTIRLDRIGRKVFENLMNPLSINDSMFLNHLISKKINEYNAFRSIQNRILLSPRGIVQRWAEYSPESLLYSDTLFEGASGKIYRWSNELEFVQMFSYSPNLEGGSNALLINCLSWKFRLLLRKLKFSISWEATVDTKCRFSKTKITNIIFVREEFTIPTPSDVQIM